MILRRSTLRRRRPASRVQKRHGERSALSLNEWGDQTPDAELRRVDALLGVPHHRWASAAAVLVASPDPPLGDDLAAALGDELAPGDPWA